VCPYVPVHASNYVVSNVLDIGVCPYLLAVPDHRQVTRYRLMFVLRHLRHHGRVLDFLVLDSSVIRLALLAPGCVVTDTQLSHGLEAQGSARALLHCHMCSQLHHPALLTQD
jgi:hypothetical protein